jgi:DNA-binding transcriptional MerR regulator
MSSDTPAPVTGAIVPAHKGPASQDLGATEAGKLLGISPRRVRAYVEANRLDVVSTKPLKVSRESVDRLLQERTEAGITPAQSTPAPVNSEQLEAITQALGAMLSELAAMRAELAEARADLAIERTTRLELEATPTPRRRWWQGKKGE